MPSSAEGWGRALFGAFFGDARPAASNRCSLRSSAEVVDDVYGILIKKKEGPPSEMKTAKVVYIQKFAYPTGLPQVLPSNLSLQYSWKNGREGH